MVQHLNEAQFGVLEPLRRGQFLADDLGQHVGDAHLLRLAPRFGLERLTAAKGVQVGPDAPWLAQGRPCLGAGSG